MKDLLLYYDCDMVWHVLVSSEVSSFDENIYPGLDKALEVNPETCEPKIPVDQISSPETKEKI